MRIGISHQRQFVFLGLGGMQCVARNAVHEFFNAQQAGVIERYRLEKNGFQRTCLR